MNFPKGMDANEYALKVKPAERSLGTALRAAHWMAGGRAVAVPSAVEGAHADNHVLAETNGSRSALRAREVVEVWRKRSEPPTRARAGPALAEVDLEEEAPPAPTPSLAADLEPEPVREDVATAAVAPHRAPAGASARADGRAARGGHGGAGGDAARRSEVARPRAREESVADAAQGERAGGARAPPFSWTSSS